MVCKSGRISAVLEDTFFLGVVSTRKKPETWTKTLKVNGTDITFKLDKGAVIPGTAYSEEWHGPLTKASVPLCGPGNGPTKVRGQFDGVIKYDKDKTTTQPLYMVQKLATPLSLCQRSTSCVRN